MEIYEKKHEMVKMIVNENHPGHLSYSFGYIREYSTNTRVVDNKIAKDWSLFSERDNSKNF